jgi:hypothetical protein
MPLSMVDSQKEADAARLTSVTFVKPAKAKRRLVDGMGIWSLAGHDMTIGGAAAGSGSVKIRNVPNLNKIVASVDPNATFERGILDPNPSRFGVLARLRLPSSAKVTAITEDRTDKIFQPGGHTQQIASYVRCEIPFANDLQAPSLRLRTFRGGRRSSYRFDAQKYDELTLTMSNLCNCLNDTKNDKKAVIDDPEFSVYYRLVKKPGLRQKPLPSIPKPVPVSGIRIPVCYNLAYLEL